MRFMVITKATADTESGRPAGTEEIARMGAFIQEMVDAGVMLAAEGIHPSAKGARIYFDGEKKTVVDGPFAETKELVGGFFLVETKTLEECVEWFKRCPNPAPGVQTNIEIRQVFTAEDFGENFTPERQAAVEALRERAAAQHDN